MCLGKIGLNWRSHYLTYSKTNILFSYEQNQLCVCEHCICICIYICAQDMQAEVGL